MKLIVVLVIIFLAAPLLQAGINPDLDALVAGAQKNNLDLKKQELAVQNAKANLGSIWKIEDTKINVGTAYSYGDTGESGPGSSAAPFSASAGISVPLLSQLSISGSMNDQGKSSVSLKFDPFQSDTDIFTSEEKYRKALNQWHAAKLKTSFDVVNGVLNWNYAESNTDNLEALYRLQSDKYEARKKSYTLGFAVYDDLAADEQNFLKARQNYYDSEKSLLQSRQAIYTLLGAGMESAAIPQIQTADLIALIAERDALISGFAGKQPASDKLKSLTLELATLEKQLAVLFPVQPGLSVTASAGLPAFSFQVNAVISLTLKDLKFKDIADLKTSLAIKKAEIAAEQYNLSLDVQMLEQGIRIAREVLALSSKDLETAETGYKEANFLFSTGERTTLELRQAELNRESAAAREYQSAMNLYSAQANYLAYFL